ncbi:sensor domain-containing diguanylate cyclase [Alteriqipengyuania sp. 357]
MPIVSESAETIRQRTLAMLEMLDTPSGDEFNTVVRAARRIFGCRTGYVSLIDVDRQWIMASEGFNLAEVPRQSSICAMAVEEGCEIVVEDLQAHPHYGQQPEVRARPEIRFFATIPLAGPVVDGRSVPIGTLCVSDDAPHSPTEEQMTELRQLCRLLESFFRARLDARISEIASLERKALVEDLRRTQRQFELAEKMAKIGHWRLDLRTQEVVWSAQTCAIHGVECADQETLLGALDFYPQQDRARIEAAFTECLESGVSYDLELDFKDKRGIMKRVRAMGEREHINGEPTALIGVFQDITDRYQLETRLRAAAHVDDLTGLANRARLNQYLDDTIASNREQGRQMALLLIDLDHFKAVNDQLGHEAGDRVLKKTASQLASEPFSGQMAARYGGDEFVMVIEDDRLIEDIEGTLDTLLDKLRFKIGREGEDLRVSATIGAAILAPENADRSALLRCADHALYEAKRAERGTASICREVIGGEGSQGKRGLRAVG